LIMTGVAFWAVRKTIFTLLTERFTIPGKLDESEWVGGAKLFPRRVFIWFGIMWVIIFVAQYTFEAMAVLQWQLIFNLVLIFGGGSFLMIRWYQLDPHKTLALRKPRPAVWIGVLIGVPSTLLTANGVFILSNKIFPVPQSWLDAFSGNLFPEGMPFWQLFILIALMPGIFEEIAFRGLLLQGLRRRFHPVMLCFVISIIFGLFHYSLYRIAPTTFMGIILTVVTMLTGSIFPAMVWHTLNNGLALWLGTRLHDLHDFDNWLYFISVVLLSLSLWIIFRNRTPYPGILPWKRNKGIL